MEDLEQIEDPCHAALSLPWVLDEPKITKQRLSIEEER